MNSKVGALIALLLAVIVAAQTPVANVTVFTSSVPRTTTTVSRGRQVVSTLFVPTTVTSTIPPSSTPTPVSQSNSTPSTIASTNSSAAAAPTPTGPPPIKLDTVLDPAFGVLGAILILTGLPSAFLGHKNRWSSYFLTGFYSLSGICLALIIKFGVLPAINPPSRSLRGLFMLSCGIAGIGGGAVCILFWQQAKYFVGALGGFALGLWVQCFRNGGVIRPIGFRWILYIASGVIGFVLCTIPRIHYHVLLAATAMVGATAFMLGVDCFTLAGVKEFYVYNLGFETLFPKFANKPFPVTQAMQIELGLIAATALAGAAVQLRVLTVLQLKLKQIKVDQRRKNDQIEARAAARFAEADKDLQLWEKQHGGSSSIHPLLKDDGPATLDGRSSEGETLIGKRVRHPSGLSDFVAPAQGSEEEEREFNDPRQGAGFLPLMNLGKAPETKASRQSWVAPEAIDESPEGTRPANIQKRESWMLDFDDIRQSVGWLGDGNEAPQGGTNDPEGSGRHSVVSRARTLSQDIGTSFRKLSNTSRPRTLSQDLDANVAEPRPRVQSMEILSDGHATNTANNGRAIGRTTSTPLRDDDWDSYVQERKLFTPPGGESDPIRTSERPVSASMLVSVPEAVKEAMAMRRQREMAFEEGRPTDVVNPVGSPTERRPHRRSNSAGHMDRFILPPARKPRADARAEAEAETPRTRTYEELAERHRRMMHDLQNPLSQKAKEEADLEAAKNRWERFKQTDKTAFERKQAEKKATQKEKPDRTSSKPVELKEMPKDRSSRRLTPGQMATIPAAGAGRRSSAAKVLEWQQYQQQDVDKEHARAVSPAPPGQSQRRSTGPNIIESSSSNNVPFPAGSRPPREKPFRRPSHADRRA